MENNFWLELAGFIGLIALSAFFAGSETALTAASKARMHSLENDGNARARLVNRLREKKHSLIGGLLFGNTMANVAASALATAVLIKIFGGSGIAYATVIVSAAVLVFAEVMPKTYAMMYADRMSLLLAPIVAAVLTVFTPITYTVERIISGVFKLCGVTGEGMPEEQEQELRGAIHLFKETTDTGREQEKGAMLRSILDLADVKVSEIMIHRKDVRMINASLPMARVIDEVLHSAFTRLPVWKDSPDNIIGVIHTKLLLSEIRHCGGDLSRVNLKNAMMEPWFIPESTTLFDQLQAFRKRREHFSIMVDEYGVLAGVVTLEDILEEIVGEISDEHDTAVTGVRPQPDGSYFIDGNVTIRDLNREFEWGLPDEEYATLAGLLLFETQRIPSVGQIFTFFGFRFEILKKQKNQIALVRVLPLSEEEKSPEQKEAGAY